MLIQHNFLRLYRKKSQLTQHDLASILNLSDYAMVSRWEQGQRHPTLQALLTYHLLFNIPIEHLFERQKHELKSYVSERVRLRIEELKSQESDVKVLQRISFLDSILIRLTPSD